MSENYYEKTLNANRLYKVYQTKYERIQSYLDAEISFVKDRLCGTENILELGAGYGRIMKEIAPYCKSIVGIDISENTVEFGESYLRDAPNTKLMVMDAHKIGPDTFEMPFEIVLCMQNALSAMKVEPFSFVAKMMRLVVPGERMFISTYSAKFWRHRLDWFHEQAQKGLLGKIIPEQTKDGVIVCEGGFRGETHTPEQLSEIGDSSGCPYEIHEVDESSLFLVITRPNRTTNSYSCLN